MLPFQLSSSAEIIYLTISQKIEPCIQVIKENISALLPVKVLLYIKMYINIFLQRNMCLLGLFFHI